jgi:Mor family transcriptional regulator
MKRYDVEFKKMIVGFYEDGKPVRELVKEYEISEPTIYY